MLKAAGHLAHRCFSFNERVAAAYLSWWDRAFRAIADDHWLKAHVRSNLLSFKWPAVTLPEKSVQIGGGVRARLVPRSGTLSYRALLREDVAYEPEVFTFLAGQVARYDAVVDIGANVGLFTLFFSSRFQRLDPARRVFAIEPSPKAFAFLAEHLRLNGAANVEALNAAVASTPGSVAFFPNERDLTKGSLLLDVARRYAATEPAAITVPAIGGERIGEWLAPFVRPLVKVDVMGADAAVLQELAPVLLEKHADIVVGVWTQNLEALNALAFLRDGYRLFRIAPSGLEARERFDDVAYCNYFLESRRSHSKSDSSTS